MRFIRKRRRKIEVVKAESHRLVGTYKNLALDLLEHGRNVGHVRVERGKKEHLDLLGHRARGRVGMASGKGCAAGPKDNKGKGANQRPPEERSSSNRMSLMAIPVRGSIPSLR